MPPGPLLDEVRAAAGLLRLAVVAPERFPSGGALTDRLRWRAAGVILLGAASVYLAGRLVAPRLGLFYDPLALSFPLTQSGAALGVLLAFVGHPAQGILFGLAAGAAGGLSGGLLYARPLGQLFALTVGAGLGAAARARAGHVAPQRLAREAVGAALALGLAFGSGTFLSHAFARGLDPSALRWAARPAAVELVAASLACLAAYLAGLGAVGLLRLALGGR